MAKNDNDMILARMRGVPAQPSTPETDADPRNGNEPWTTRRAPHMERFTQIQPVVVQDFPDAHTLSLKVGNQAFRIDSGWQGFYDTKEEAEWARDMLCIALDRLQRGEDL